MAVEVRSEEGQSIIEFLLLLPLMIGITIMMLRTNMAIQVSIGNQKYSRMQAHHLTFNSPYFPQTSASSQNQRAPGMHRLVVGVGEDAISNGKGRPKAVEVFVARSRSIASGSSDQSGAEPDSRANVRVRTTVALCSFSNRLGSGKPATDSKEWVKLDGSSNGNPDQGKIFKFCDGASRGDQR